MDFIDRVFETFAKTDFAEAEIAKATIAEAEFDTLNLLKLNSLN